MGIELRSPLQQEQSILDIAIKGQQPRFNIESFGLGHDRIGHPTPRLNRLCSPLPTLLHKSHGTGRKDQPNGQKRKKTETTFKTPKNSQDRISAIRRKKNEKKGMNTNRAQHKRCKITYKNSTQRVDRQLYCHREGVFTFPSYLLLFIVNSAP
jgi:hypothetical protein